MIKRDVPVLIKLTQEEKNNLKQKAQEQDMSLSAYIRKKLLRRN